MTESYSRTELERRFEERREEFLRLFRSRVLQGEALPQRLNLALSQNPDGSFRLADPDAFQDAIAEWMASAFVEGLHAFFDVVFSD